MLEHLFGSKTRLRLLRHFFHNPDRCFYVREITRLLDTQINAVRREIMILLKLGVIKEAAMIEKKAGGEKKQIGEGKRRYYCLNSEGTINPELQSLLIKAQFWGEKQLVEAIKNLGSVDYLILTGRFTGAKESPTDLLIVGNVSHKELERLVRLFEKEFGNEARYTVMPLKEFLYRRDVADKFLSDLMEQNHIVAVDKIHKT